MLATPSKQCKRKALKQSASSNGRPPKRHKLKSSLTATTPSTNTSQPATTSARDPSTDLVADPSQLFDLQASYNVTTISIISSSSINAKIRNLLFHFEQCSAPEKSSQQRVVVLRAKAKVASKLVTVVEIAKKEIECSKGRWWQYSNVTARYEKFMMAERPLDDRKVPVNRSEKLQQDAQTSLKNDSASTINDSQDEFEEMSLIGCNGSGSWKQGQNKVKAVTILTIFLASTSIPKLKELFG
ncbi:MAG: hypothetical protein LQ351_004764 [Letrouitia transgressa]|nr:MAG: hypothetical protein LQ351_004764 [Letrouitia transgressa]